MMRPFLRKTLLQKIAALSLLISLMHYLLSCSSTRYLTKDDLAHEDKLTTIYVQTKDDRLLKLSDPMMEGGILTGYLEGVTYTELDTSLIVSLSMKKLNKGATLLIGLAGVTATILFLTSQAHTADDCHT